LQGADPGEIEMFNTLRYAKKLEAAGVLREHAEAHVQIIAEIIEVDLATKQDLRELEFRLFVKLGTLMSTLIALSTGIMALLLKS
jgi:hypothetical protein